MEIGWKAFGKEIPNYFRRIFVVLKFKKIVGNVHKKLILEAFEKARGREAERGYTDPAKSSLAKLLSDFIEAEFKFQFGERSLRDYYSQALEGNPIEIKQPKVLDGLSHYLGYKDYSDYLLENSREGKVSTASEKEMDTGKRASVKPFLKRNKITFVIVVTAVLIVSGISIFSHPKWMEWDGTHYIETPFDAEKLKAGILKPFKQDRIDDFKRLEPNCHSQFFNEDKSVRVWYGKNSNGTWEYFSSYGLHPQTGKTLKPITQYIIDKYICN